MTGFREAGSARKAIKRIARWLPVAAFFILSTLGHLAFSLWLVREHRTPLGTIKPVDHLDVLFAVVATAVLGWLAFSARRGERRGETLFFWGLWTVAVVAVDRVLVFSIPEYFHYPQYAILAWLMARALDPGRKRVAVGSVLFWTTLLGVLDELFQYLYLTVDYSDYFDFNDVLLNLLGAAAGVLVYYGFHPLPDSRSGSAWSLPIAGAVLVLLVAIPAAAGRLAIEPPGEVSPGGIGRDEAGRAVLYLQREPGIYGSQQPARDGGTHYVMRPTEGLPATLVAGLAFGIFAWRNRRYAGQPHAPVQGVAGRDRVQA